MASDRDRKLIAILAALLQGGSSYFGAKSAQEERDRDRERQAASDARSDRGMALQEKWYERSAQQDELRATEATRREANTVNERAIGQAATLGEARGYNRIKGTESAPIAQGAGAKSVASETIPLVTGDNQIDIDLQRILSGIRGGGDVGTMGQAAGQADAQRGFLSSVRGAEQSRDISGAVARQQALMPGQLDLARGQAAISASFREGPSGPSETEVRSREELAITGTAQSYADQGLTGQEIAGRLIAENKGTDPRILVGIAVDAARDARRAAGSNPLSGSPASPVMQQGRIRNQRTQLGMDSQLQREWDALAAEVREKGGDPVKELGPRP